MGLQNGTQIWHKNAHTGDISNFKKRFFGCLLFIWKYYFNYPHNCNCNNLLRPIVLMVDSRFYFMRNIWKTQWTFLGSVYFIMSYFPRCCLMWLMVRVRVRLLKNDYGERRLELGLYIFSCLTFSNEIWVKWSFLWQFYGKILSQEQNR